MIQTPFSPFYLYDSEMIRAQCKVFHDISYQNKAIHFASMANIHHRFLGLVRLEGINVFVNSVEHLKKAHDAGFRRQEIIFTASALDREIMKVLHEDKVCVYLDSLEQFRQWQTLFPGSKVGIRCNIGEMAEAFPTHAGYFIGRESRLGLCLDEVRSLAGNPMISGLHLYIGTDIFDVNYFLHCYRQLCELSLVFPGLETLNFGGGFGVAESGDRHFDFHFYGHQLGELMREMSIKHGKSIRLILEPGRIIGGEAGYFVCRVTDIKERNGQFLLGVNASSTQFPRPLFYPEIARHPVILMRNGDMLEITGMAYQASIYGCSTYSRDFLAREVRIPFPAIGDVVILGNAGSYSASSHTSFLGFPPAAEVFI